MTKLCNWCYKSKQEIKHYLDSKEYPIIGKIITTCSEGLEPKEYSQGCEKFGPYEWLKYQADDLVQLRSLDKGVKKKLLALNEIF